jgi:hypothetical protein
MRVARIRITTVVEQFSASSRGDEERQHEEPWSYGGVQGSSHLDWPLRVTHMEMPSQSFEGPHA